jgi:murein DD-endopeptidase MepM/ murein hydrolase activator NlpD
LKQLQAEIAKYQKELDALGAKKNTLQSTIGGLTVAQQQLVSKIKATQNKISSANLQIEKLTFSIGDKETAISADEMAIAKALRTVAQTEEVPLIAQIISADSLQNAWQTADESFQFNRALNDHISDLRTVRIALSQNRDAVSQTKTQLVSLNQDLGLQKKSIDINKNTQQKLLTDTKNQESTYQQILADKRAEETKFETALFDLQSRLQYAIDPSHIPPSGTGVLHWPLASVFVTQQFGQTSSSGRLYASGTHNGVDFRASVGTPVFAALTGVVMDVNFGAVQNCQYGKWVLIKHPNGLATLYGHLSDISVTKGQSVSTGQVIGYSGSTGYATGPHLHLGLYLAEAITFQQYTCKSGYTVNIPVAPIKAYLDPLSYL